MRSWLVGLAVLAAACREVAPCVPGEQRSCDCGAALVGVQVCSAAGAFGDCAQCAAPMMPVDAAPDAPPIDARPDAPPDAAPDAAPLAPTGAACGSDGDCSAGTCDTSLPGGYCTAACDPTDASPTTGIDPNCPGGAGYCQPVGAAPECLATCSAHADGMPCRNGYSCFAFGCLPTAASQCDPTQAGSCTGGDVCLGYGLDPVGFCRAPCDVFAQGCPNDAGGAPQGCYIVNGLGDEGCAPTAQHADGASCWNIFDCAPGEQCVGKTCRPFCGGPGNVACTTGTCTAVSGSVPTTVGGVCVP